MSSLGSKNNKDDQLEEKSSNQDDFNNKMIRNDKNSLILSEVPLSKKKVSFKFREWKSVNVNRLDYRKSNLLKKDTNNNLTLIEKLQTEIDKN